jgi:uroporphyrinogen-III synthase
LEGIGLTEADFIRATQVPFDAPDLDSPNTAIVFTSSNAVRFAAAGYAQPATLPLDIYCLEGATQEEVSTSFAAGRIRGVAGDASGLAREIIARSAKTVIFFCGSQRRDELPRMLAEHGVEVREVVVYTTMPTPRRVTEMPHAVLFFSPSAVISFFSLNQLPVDVPCFAIGSTTAAAIRAKAGRNTIITATRPEQDAMLVAIFNHFQLSSFEPTQQ